MTTERRPTRRRLLVLLILVLLLWRTLTPTLFEDGSVQVLNTPGVGICLPLGWGCED